jgi:dynein heavy chain, axonemal
MSEDSLSRTNRHQPVIDIVEPKVYVPYESKPGFVPRRIEIERKKRLYASFDINDNLTQHGIIEYLLKTMKSTNVNSIDAYSLSLFDNTDFEPQSLEYWAYMVNSSDNGLPARAMQLNENSCAWRPCRVIKSQGRGELFDVMFEAKSMNEKETTETYERIFICFNAEDPNVYCQRVCSAVDRKKEAFYKMALNLYVDCMPTDNLRLLDSEQVIRITNQSTSAIKLKSKDVDDFSVSAESKSPNVADTMSSLTSIIHEYNLNHTRTMNQLSFSNILKNQAKSLVGMQAVSLDWNFFPAPKSIFTPYNPVTVVTEIPFSENCREFKFKSLYTKPEAIRIILQMQQEIINVERVKYSSRPEKTLRIEEFVSSHQASASAMTQTVKETWTNAITTSIRNNVKDIKKGWLNIDEANFEVYNFSRLKRFLIRINIMMEDSIRNIMYRSAETYVETISKFCPKSVKILSNANVALENATFPLFIVDLKFISPTLQQPNASFIYSSPKKALFDAIIAPFDQSFDLLKGIVQVERRIMKKLFWASEPVVRIPHAQEEWAVSLREKLVNAVSDALSYMDLYLEQLHGFLDIISLDIKSYANDAEAKYCNGETLNLAELCLLAKNHMVEADAVFHKLPSSINLGMVLVDCKIVKNLLSAKHKNIASRLFEIIELKTRDYSEALSQEFRELFDKLNINPTTVEVLTEMKDFLATLPSKIEAISEKIATCMSYFDLLEEAKVQVSTDHLDLRWDVYRWPFKMTHEMARQEKNFRALEHQFRRSQEEEQQEFNQDLLNLQGDIGKLKDFTALSNYTKYATTVRRIQRDLNIAIEKARVFNARELLFGSPQTEYTQLHQYEKLFEPYFDLWDSTDNWMQMKEIWNTGPFVKLEAEEVENTVTTLSRNLAKSLKSFERLNLPLCAQIATEMRDEVDTFKPRVPIITALRNPGMRDRHWNELSQSTGTEFPKDKTFVTLQQLVDLGLVKSMPEVEKIAEKAGKEYSIESALNKMAKAWENVMLIIEPYRETGTFILKGIDDYLNLLDEHITMTQAMAFSAFKGPFEDRIDKWNNSLQVISEVIDEWIQLQRNWLYLQPIFDAPDINKQLPQEGKRFATVDKYWRTTMTAASRGVLAVRFCDDVRLCERLKEGNKLLEAVQKGLADYLETKRAGFSRFYFLSNDELLEILSESKDPLRVQPHLKKCFEGIKSVDFQEDLTIAGMISPEGEYVKFVKAVDPKNKNLEVWMTEVLDGMMAAVRFNMLSSIIDYTAIPRTQWMQKWTAQCVLNGSQVHWTREVEEHIKSNGNDGCWKYYRQFAQQLDDMVLLIRGNISKLARITIGSLAVIDVHARDVLQKMAESGVSNITDFDWISQMRYYWAGDLTEQLGDLQVIMVSSMRMYGNEYLGNTFRLVITPLTDKCYLTLMGALQMMLNGSCAGPAGSGKTETTKDLAKALAKQCVVFNCSDGLDYLAMGKFFKGLASSGAWACFDEFNRINIEVLSVIAQQVTQLQTSIQRGEKRTIFEGTDIVVNPDFAVFITMNPGYAGRAELPDNLEALFRPVAMMVPDYCLIAEIMLFSYGYMENRKCAQKMVATFRLCSEQLSSQDHYDYGMRAVKTVITAAGNLKRNNMDANEEALLMRALQDVNVPKFLAHDLPLFYGILSDLFPGIERPAFNYGPLLTALKDSIAEKNLQPTPIFLRKNIELYEMICVR